MEANDCLEVIAKFKKTCREEEEEQLCTFFSIANNSLSNIFAYIIIATLAKQRWNLTNEILLDICLLQNIIYNARQRRMLRCSLLQISFLTSCPLLSPSHFCVAENNIFERIFKRLSQKHSFINSKRDTLSDKKFGKETKKERQRERERESKKERYKKERPINY